MAITSTGVLWLEDLYTKGVFRKSRSIIELGPQDLHVSRGCLRAFVMRMLKDSQATEQFMSTISESESTFSNDSQKHFYKLFGLNEYRSIDLMDDRADIMHDLNRKLVGFSDQFGVVTNLGTLEHLFNIGQAFETIHNLLRVGGVALHVCPTEGQYGHGFYNLHSNVYINMAKANNYEIVSMIYLRNLKKITKHFDKHFHKRPKFTEISRKDVDRIRYNHPISIFTIENLISCLRREERPFNYIFAALRKTAEQPFSYSHLIFTIENLISCLTKEEPPFNYIFVTLRKTVEQPFVYPQQAESFPARADLTKVEAQS